jgi:hypothetical protein
VLGEEYGLACPRQAHEDWEPWFKAVLPVDLEAEAINVKSDTAVCVGNAKLGSDGLGHLYSPNLTVLVYLKRAWLRSPPLIAIVAQEHYDQGIFMAGQVSALGNIAILAPGLVERAAAHLARCLMDTIQRLVTDDASFLV